MEGLFVPLYEYLCAKCGHRFEKIENHNASTTKKCPKCGAKSTRVLSAAAIQFKGSGWYVTDYSGKASGGDSQKSDTASADSSKAATSKESTPAKETKTTKKEKT